jgi:hypothetical protein
MRLLSLLLALGLTGCAATNQGQDPFDVALGMAAAQIMSPEGTDPDLVNRAFAAAIAPPVVNQTIVQQAPKQGGGQ